MNWWIALGVFVGTVAVSLPLSLYWIHRMAKDQKRRTAEIMAASDRVMDLYRQYQDIGDALGGLNKVRTKGMV